MLFACIDLSLQPQQHSKVNSVKKDTVLFTTKGFGSLENSFSHLHRRRSQYFASFLYMIERTQRCEISSSIRQIDLSFGKPESFVSGNLLLLTANLILQ